MQEKEQNSKNPLTQEQLKEYLYYDENTGIFTWVKQPRKGLYLHSVAGTSDRLGYTFIKLLGRRNSAHRLAWLYVYGSYPKNEIDHINHRVYDNRLCNLRDVTHLENKKNSKKQSNNTSGITGVRWSEKLKKWNAYIGCNGKIISLGHFVQKKNAVMARNEAKISLGFHKNHA
ncbi:MAG: endonuclease [Parcubacteria group bacterium]|nr:endonuclease [Parcubacteria group bacterium]|tara:strand:- start:3555 stop:4073 length:519 start_codon:yes stop_codon:yes gene_type:complete